MKSIFTVVLLVVMHCAQGQISYSEWKEQEKTNIRLLPEYGRVPKNEGQLSADAEFIKECLRNDTTLEKASERHVGFGFNYFYKGDIKTAMYRFNQAWLLNPKNENAYWGFGVIYFSFGDYNKALQQFEKALALNAKSSVILTDKATVYMVMFHEGGRQEFSDKAIDLFKKSYDLDPQNQNTLFKLSAAYFALKDCKNAKRYLGECQRLGGKPVTKEFVNAMRDTCGD